MIHKHLLFVYGTLKKGFYNHKTYLQPALACGAAVYVGDAKTVQAFPLLVGGERHIPFLLHRPNEGHRVSGEVYELTDGGLEAMDILEGVAKGVYRRELVAVEGHSDCWAYFQGKKAEDNPIHLDEFYDEYTLDLHVGYVPPTAMPDPRIFACLEKES